MSESFVPLGPPARRDVGLGTAYERWAVYELLGRWLRGFEAATALEGPIDGMAGIPGLHLIPAAARGARVTVLVPDDLGARTVDGVYRLLRLQERLDVRVASSWPANESFDVVLTYNALPSVADWRAYLAEAAARARRHLIVSVTHPASYGVYLRRVLRLFQPGSRELLELFDHPSTHGAQLIPELSRYGTLESEAFVDCPWWPDLFVETGQTLFSGTLARLPFGARFRRAVPAGGEPVLESAPFLYGPERFPFLRGEGWKDEMEPAIKRHPNLDGPNQTALAGLLAHHCMRAVKRP